ncbi:PfkB family carbohydrate kinase [Trinickia mobilis]|uniref:PfkB family carbohydrate kinase n=1 Tax=Trinickia mobilis TaxID=2816356 RepID=UPI001A8C02AD|nr:PfkB family carbohydrate kinase [Trinickia mobilis]
MKVLVAGSAHLDILARPLFSSHHKDRIGTVSLEAGGTACNVAFGLRRLEQQVRLLTAWGTTPMERLMASHVQSTGVELFADEVPGMPLAAFAAQLTASGDLECAVSATPVDTHRFTDTRIAEAVSGVDCVILDANLNSETMCAIAECAREKGLPVFALAVSEDKVERVSPVLPKLNAVFMNAAECERLMAARGAADASEIADAAGTTLFVTRGERGAVVYLQDGGRVRIQPPALDGTKTLLGLGDAFSVGVIDGLVRFGMTYADAAAHAHVLVREIAKADACNAFSLNALNRMLGALYETARNDQLTGLMRRSAFEIEYRRFQEGWQNTLLVIDCDHFKNVNDTHGHLTGDAVLQGVANVIKSSVRGGDLPCRWGGDEFVVLLPRTDLRDGHVVGERIRKSAERALLHGVTLSLGVATAVRGEPLASIVERADAAMYDAKRGGRNAIALAQIPARA